MCARGGGGVGTEAVSLRPAEQGIWISLVFEDRGALLAGGEWGSRQGVA